MHDPMSEYECQTPELIGKRIQGYFHGWMILSNYPYKVMWSLWNPKTSKTIRLPPLTLKDDDFESINQCFLSSPPNNPTSILMLTRTERPTFVFCQLHRKRKRLGWKEMTYAKQLESIICDNGFLHSLTCCNGKVYALSAGGRFDCFIQVDIAVKDKEVVISLLSFIILPYVFNDGCFAMKPFLKGYCNDLFYIKVGFDKMAKERLGVVCLFKYDMISMDWKEVKDLKDVDILLTLAHDGSVFNCDASASELQGSIEILGEMGNVMYSYDVKDRTITLSCMACLDKSTNLSPWECRLHGDSEEIEWESSEDDECDINNTRDIETFEPHCNIPFDILKMIMEFCVGVEYLNFRLTCKSCLLVAPMIKWSNETQMRRLQTYSLISPWLMVFDKHRGGIIFTDPMCNDKYVIRTPRRLMGDLRIYCSRYGWLLLCKINGLRGVFFYNPFTKDIRQLPYVPLLDSISFLEPPTSPDCMVVGFSTSLSFNVYMYCPGASSWTTFNMDFGGTTPHSLLFTTMYPEGIFALNQGALHVFLENEEGSSFQNHVVAKAPRISGCSSPQYFLVSCDQDTLLVVMDELGEFVEVFRPNISTKKWVKIDSLGKKMVFICGNTCVCMEAKTPEMENKIYFPRLDTTSGKILFYSLETCMYHTFSDTKMEQCLGDFFDTKYHVNPHTWIEPSWS